MTTTLQDHKGALIAAANAFADACTSEAIRRTAGIELQLGERYAGVLLNEDGTPSHHLVLLPGDADDITWSAAVEWAKAAGGELPTRREQALLFANAKSAFEEAWYWSGQEYEEPGGSYAWYQDFGYGVQYYLHKGYEGRARAIRRVTA
jgi:hypothetical protein